MRSFSFIFEAYFNFISWTSSCESDSVVAFPNSGTSKLKYHDITWAGQQQSNVDFFLHSLPFPEHMQRRIQAFCCGQRQPLVPQQCSQYMIRVESRAGESGTSHYCPTLSHSISAWAYYRVS